jgi:hypothetical protein
VERIEAEVSVAVVTDAGVVMPRVDEINRLS